MKEKKFVLNVERGTLHVINGCPNGKVINGYPRKLYSTIDEAIAENQHYIRKCKHCFKNK